jgi:hypothetical protein
MANFNVNLNATLCMLKNSELTSGKSDATTTAIPKQNISQALQFWIDRRAMFPLLAPFALDLLSMPASQAYVENAFSPYAVI